jgi:hypothetical protein
LEKLKRAAEIERIEGCLQGSALEGRTGSERNSFLYKNKKDSAKEDFTPN